MFEDPIADLLEVHLPHLCAVGGEHGISELPDRQHYSMFPVPSKPPGTMSLYVTR
jgi:hypothetical protein